VSATAVAPAGLRLELATSIADFDPQPWDAVATSDDLQATHRFVRACEDSGVEHAAYRHAIVWDAEGPAAVASFSRMLVSLDLLSTGVTRAAIRAARHVRPAFLRVPVVFGGLPVSFGRSCLRVRPGADRARVLRALHEVAERFAAETATPMVCFKEFDADQAARLEPLAALGYVRAPSLPSCRLALPWTSFDAYVAAMRSGYRRQLLASLEARARERLTVRVVDDWLADCPRIFALYEQVMDRAPFQLERLNLAFFEQLAIRLRGETRAIVVEQGGAAVAAAVMLFAPRLATWLLAGIDYEVNRRCQAYLNVVAEVVRAAIASGAPALEMGQTSYDLKGRMGAVTAPRTLLLRYRSRLGHALLRAGRDLLFPVPAVRVRRVFREA
jgi:predicted N-acyltransferase